MSYDPFTFDLLMAGIKSIQGTVSKIRDDVSDTKRRFKDIENAIYEKIDEEEEDEEI